MGNVDERIFWEKKLVPWKKKFTGSLKNQYSNIKFSWEVLQKIWWSTSNYYTTTLHTVFFFPQNAVKNVKNIFLL